VNLSKTELGHVPGDALRYPLALQKRAAGLLRNFSKPPPSLEAAREVMAAVHAAAGPKVSPPGRYSLHLYR